MINGKARCKRFRQRRFASQIMVCYSRNRDFGLGTSIAHLLRYLDRRRNLPDLAKVNRPHQ
jgi:hypothetical protein